jgi:hypothetical protein
VLNGEWDASDDSQIDNRTEKFEFEFEGEGDREGSSNLKKQLFSKSSPNNLLGDKISGRQGVHEDYLTQDVDTQIYRNFLNRVMVS